MDREGSVLAVILILAAMGALDGTEVGIWGAVDAVELGLAGRGDTGLVRDGDADAGGGGHGGVGQGVLAGLAQFGLNDGVVATEIGGGHFERAGWEHEDEATLGVGMAGDGGFSKRHLNDTGGDAFACGLINEAACDGDELLALSGEDRADGIGGGGANGEEALDHDFLAGGEFEFGGKFFDTFEFKDAEGVAAFVSRVDGVHPIDASGTALDVEAVPVVAGGDLGGLVGFVAENGRDEDAAVAFADAILVALENTTIRSGGDDGFDGGGVGFFGGDFADVGNGAVAAGRVDDELVVVGATQSEVVEAAWADAVVTVKGAHVGAAEGRVVGDDGFDEIVAQDEVASDAIGLFAAGELIFETGAGFHDFSSLCEVPCEEEGDEESGGGAVHGWSGVGLSRNAVWIGVWGQEKSGALEQR